MLLRFSSFFGRESEADFAAGYGIDPILMQEQIGKRDKPADHVQRPALPLTVLRIGETSRRPMDTAKTIGPCQMMTYPFPTIRSASLINCGDNS